MPSSKDQILEYIPKQLEVEPPAPAMAYHENKSYGSDFKMDDLIKIQIGVHHMESNSIEELIEKKVLEGLEKTETEAYQQAFTLGQEEGKKAAFEEFSKELRSQMTNWNQLIDSLQKIKEELFLQNQSLLVKWSCFVATQLAKKAIIEDDSILLGIIQDAISFAQSEEKIVVRIHPKQHEFLKEIVQKEIQIESQANKENEFLKNLQLESDASVDLGGCIVETNYGVVDARMEEKIGKLWETLHESLHVVRDRISA